MSKESDSREDEEVYIRFPDGTTFKFKAHITRGEYEDAYKVVSDFEILMPHERNK